ncbi:MAG TPA: ABC transporter permease [Anaerolineae bacterium]|nr:ABC transporter permease [Anaerolineae bacterium]
MSRYIIRRFLQAVPTLLFVSVVVYGLIIISPVDPLAIYEENPDITPADMAMLEYRLGLRQPAFLNFRGSAGTLNTDVVLLNKVPSAEGSEPTVTGELAAGTKVAIIDGAQDESGERWIKVLHLDSRTTGWTLREHANIRINPLDSRYFKWLFALLQGDLGYSNVEHRPALDMILERLPATLLLMSISFIGQLLVGLPIGVISAVKQYSLFDHVFTVLAYAGRSIPIFWFGLILIIIFHATLTWPSWAGDMAGKPLFPGGGMYDVRLRQELGYTPWWDYVYHLILPVTMLSIFGAAQYMRYMRASMLEVIHQDYIRTARAKGLTERAILYGHALKNAAIPVVTVMALGLPILFAGALFTETIFSWPGMGKLYFRSAQRVDYAVLMGYLMISASLIIFFNIVADIVYALLDPRIRYD